jgi:rubrerythrin
MTEPENAIDVDLAGFREVVRHPQAHALILQQYRIGEYAGVIGLERLLGEMRPEGSLHRAMEIHHRDEERHSRVFTEWIYRLGVEPEPMPTQVEAYFANSPEDFRRDRELLQQLPTDIRRIITFAAINAIERLAFNQFETHLRVLDRPEDRAALEGVMAEEKFHLRYVEHELERAQQGEHGGFVSVALEQARERFAQFSETKRRQSRAALERLLGAADGSVPPARRTTA